MRTAPLLLAIVAALAFGASSISAATTQVTISKTGFNPAAVTVRPGDTVTWTNTDTAAHQVVGDHGAFTSPVLQPGQSYSFTFTTSGKFNYHDATQPKRKGSVTVSANAPVVTLTASKKQVTYGGTLTLSGSVSPQQTGQKVTVLARECNTTNYVPVGDAITTTGGAWSFVVKPHRLTVYEARWKNATSPVAGVNVAPRVRIAKLLSPRRFVVRVTGPQSYVGKYVLFQRYSASLSRWVTLKRVVLRHATAGTAPTVVSSVTFRSAIKRGLRVRAFMTRAQTGACFVAGLQRSHPQLTRPRVPAAPRRRRHARGRRRAAAAASASHGAGCATRSLDVAGDLVDQRLLGLEYRLVAQALPQLDDEPLPVQVALEVEQERLDPPLRAAVLRVRPDRDRRARAGRGARVDPVRGHQQARRRLDVRGREAEARAARVARHDHALHLRRAPEQARGGRDLPRVQQLPDVRRGDALHERHRPHVEAELPQQVEIARTRPAEAEPRPRHHDLRPDRLEHTRDEVLRLPPRHALGELDHEHVLDPGLQQQLDPPLERREQLDLLAEHLPRVRVERDGRRRESVARVERGLEHAPVPAVDAVEGAERDRPRPLLELASDPRHRHSRASASSGGTIRSSSASSTENGPTSVRRSVAQCPPSASAIERTYVPELTSRSSRATRPS